MSNIIAIPFHNDIINTINIDGKVFVILKHLCENLGLNWEPQRKRIERDSVLSVTTSIMEVVTTTGKKETLCLPLEYINGFLFGISDSQIQDSNIKDKVVKYKFECYHVLYNHFHHKSNSTEISNSDIFSKIIDLTKMHGDEITETKRDLISLEKDVAGAFKIQQEQIYELNTRLSIEIAVLKNTIEIHNDQYRLGAYAQANQIKQAASKTIASARYIPIKAAKTDENLKPRIEEYSRIFGYYTLSNKLLKWAFDRGSEIKKLGNLNTYPYQLLLDFFDPRYNKELSKFIDFSKFKEYKKG